MMAPQDFRTRRVRAATPPARGALSRRGCQRISFRWRPKRDGRGSISCTSDDRRRSPLVISTNAALARTDAAAIVRGAGSNPGDA